MNNLENVNPVYRIEADKLIKGLTKQGVEFDYYRFWDGVQVSCNEWDAVCYSGSYGHERGLLELIGTIVRPVENDVEGYLTAEEILQRLNLTI